MGEFKGRSKTTHNRLGSVPASGEPVTIKVKYTSLSNCYNHNKS